MLGFPPHFDKHVKVVLVFQLESSLMGLNHCAWLPLDEQLKQVLRLDFLFLVFLLDTSLIVDLKFYVP